MTARPRFDRTATSDKPHAREHRYIRLSRVDASTWTHPVGTAVVHRRDDGSDFVTRTRTRAWNITRGMGVVCIEGHKGSVALDRVRLADGEHLRELVAKELKQLRLF